MFLTPITIYNWLIIFIRFIYCDDGPVPRQPGTVVTRQRQTRRIKVIRCNLLVLAGRPARIFKGLGLLSIATLGVKNTRIRWHYTTRQWTFLLRSRPTACLSSRFLRLAIYEDVLRCVESASLEESLVPPYIPPSSEEAFLSCQSFKAEAQDLKSWLKSQKGKVTGDWLMRVERLWDLLQMQHRNANKL